ncbi:AMP-binding enzyme domain-containing protein [Periconia macrospinosa]|uniref:AMP-binding enzyme domain-containing protein n=1 Tax=Periconia macrospinosa TaxID=97972 RepID=A0A2V1D390_9PLEO|nr:AMP-binding enzyme domain-containing protein [Periconia macrospinosa]
MRFISKLAGVTRPRSDVFTYLFESRRSYPADRVLYREDKSKATLTLAELEHKSRQFATVLVERFNIQVMDPVAVLASDSIYYPIVYLGILAAGATVQLIPLQKELAVQDVVARMKAAGSKILITNAAMQDMANEASQLLSGIPVYDPSKDETAFSDGTLEFCGFSISDHSSAESTVGFLNRTSGSTGGKMKTVITTHSHFIATLDATVRTVPQNTDPDQDVWLSTLSLGFFINAKLNIGLNILLGIPVVLMNEPFHAANFDIIGRHRISFLFIPPPVAISIAGMSAAEARKVDVSSVKWLLSAGAAMHEGVSKAVSKNLNDAHLDLEWGTSETLLIAMQMDGHSSPPGSAGRLVNGIEAMVVDTYTGEPVGPGIDGEILVRNSAARFAGYKGDQAANQSTFDGDGWFHSGDYGSIDDNNNVFIKDRMKELIRVGSGYGVHISAVELESAIFEHPAVAEVIVTGVPNPRIGLDLPTAFVILSLEWQSRRAEALLSLQQWAQKHLVGLQTLTGGFVIVDKFPLIGFKINRRALKALVTATKTMEQTTLEQARALEQNTQMLDAERSSLTTAV